MKNNKGFTLIEMLVVIAIIAVLVSVVIPTVTAATTKAEAAADAANLRSVLGYMNSVLMTDEKKIDETAAAYNPPASKYTPGAELHVLYTVPGVIDVYFVLGDQYYGLAYLSDVAADGSSSRSTTAPTIGSGDIWYKVGS